MSFSYIQNILFFLKKDQNILQGTNMIQFKYKLNTKKNILSHSILKVNYETMIKYFLNEKKMLYDL